MTVDIAIAELKQKKTRRKHLMTVGSSLLLNKITATFTTSSFSKCQHKHPRRPRPAVGLDSCPLGCFTARGGGKEELGLFYLEKKKKKSLGLVTV